MDTHPTFAERTARMFAIVADLRAAADELHAEADRMHRAQERFSARRADGNDIGIWNPVTETVDPLP